MKAENHGLVLWGNVGSGKSYFAGCIANALMEREIPVCMTNFATILNNLFYGSENRNEYIVRLCSYPLLILDDFGMERGTEYGLVDFDIGFIGSEHFASGFQYSFVIVVIYKRLNTHGS